MSMMIVFIDVWRFECHAKPHGRTEQQKGLKCTKYDPSNPFFGAKLVYWFHAVTNENNFTTHMPSVGCSKTSSVGCG